MGNKKCCKFYINTFYKKTLHALEQKYFTQKNFLKIEHYLFYLMTKIPIKHMFHIKFAFKFNSNEPENPKVSIIKPTYTRYGF